MCKKLSFLILLVLLPGLSDSVSAVTWTNAYPWSAVWHSEENWDPPVVPGPYDEAFINPPPEQGPIIDSDVIITDIYGPRYDSDSNQNMYLLHGTVLVNGSWVFGDNGNGTSVIHIAGDTDVTVNDEMRHRQGNAEIYIADSAILTCNYWLRLADSGSAILDISGEPNIVIAGDLRGAYNTGAWFEAYISGGSVSVGGDFRIGDYGSGAVDISGGDISCEALRLVTRAEACLCTLGISGGELYVEDAISVCQGQGTATMNMSGGDVNTSSLLLPDGSGSGTLNMTGGSLVVRGAFMGPEDSNGATAIHLDEGTIECGSFTHAAAYAMDINEGVLIIDSDVNAAIFADINAGYIGPHPSKEGVMTDYNNIHPGRTTVWAVPHIEVVPDLVGTTRSAAQTTLAELGLVFAPVVEEYNDIIPADIIISQEPNGGTVVPMGYSVGVLVSLGQPVVPDVVGITLSEATTAIEAVDSLTVGTVIWQHSDTVDVGVVISHNPVGGTAVPIGSEVDLVVSLGRPLVPDVVGQAEAVAVIIVEAVDDLTAAVTYEYDNTVPATNIISQDPVGGTTVPIGSTIDLVVSLGQPVVPYVVGMTETDATTAIKAVDNLTVAPSYEYSDTVAAGTVFSQDPTGGTEVNVGTTVSIVVSLGQPVVPDVVGMHVSDAVAAITAVDHLRVETFTYGYSSTVPVNHVISQSPVGATTVPVGSSVELEVCLGPPIVPDVVGMAEADAVAAIEAVDNLSTSASYVYHNTIPAGYVISQNPVGGTSVLIGSIVDLVVSLGRPVVPDVVGTTQADANSAITAVDDLAVGMVTHEHSDTVPAGDVISQNPVGGAMVPIGSYVDLVVSLGGCVVPDLRRVTLAQAQVIIDYIGCVIVGTVTYEYSDTVPPDEIIDQDPPPGAIVPIGTGIDLVISLGKPVVPDVVDMTEADANLVVTAVDNLVIGTSAYEYNDTVTAGFVISQDPASGTEVLIGSMVGIVVSLGRPVVPDVVGQTRADAAAAITAVDNLAVNVTEEYSETVTEGIVISQDPLGGTTVPIGSSVGLVVSLGQPTLMVLGGNRLVELQNNDGGWDPPPDDGLPDSGSDPYTFASAALGLAQAYRQNRQTSDPNMLAALQKAGTFLLNKVHDFVSSDGCLAVELDNLLGGTDYRTYVKTNFYDKLASGTYADARSGLFDCNTAEYVQAQRDRHAGGLANLAAWDLGLGLYNAHIIGASTTEWIAGVKAEIDELDGNNAHDVLGLAGAVLGLAVVGEDYDPQAGECAAASNLSDLAEILAGFQLNTGGFTWLGKFMEEGLDETVQETVYALMALSEFDRAGYLSAIDDASTYLQDVQLVTAGWENYTGCDDGEDNEITGDALSGIAAAIPVLGDLDKDGEVGLADFAVFASAWLTEAGQPRWNPDCDISELHDDIINELDLAVFTDNWLAGAK